MKGTIIIIALAVLALLFQPISVTYAQEESSDKTLNGQFQEMLDKSNTYTDYKVIKKTRLNTYSRAVRDSVSSYRSEINGLKTEVAEQKSQISSLDRKITELEQKLEESESLRESLSFLGIQLNKATYHIIVWVIIAALVVFGVFAYSSFMRSNKVTANTKKEYKQLEQEFEDHKKRSHERQIKMGRELQTERNKVEELKAKMKVKSPGKPQSF